jgi:hypothetical protein
VLLREPLAGTTVHTSPGTPGHVPAWFPQVKFINHLFVTGQIPGAISPYKREAGGSNPPAPTKFYQLDGLFETLIGDSVTTAGNHRCMLPDGEGCPAAMASASTTRARRAPTAGTNEDAEVAPHAVKLAQTAVGALREWQVDQAPDREAAGSHWQDTGRVFTTATGTPLGARAHPQDVPGRLRKGRGRPGLGASGPSAHVRLAAVRRWHGDREDRTACRPCQQPCHRDRLPTRAPAGPAGGRRGNGLALRQRQE